MSIVEYSYGFYEKAIPSHICERIIKVGLSKKNNFGTIASASINDIKNSPKLFKKLIEKRDSNIRWLNDPWIYKSIMPFVEKANAELKWDFQFEGSESAQFTIYHPGQFYSWHQDNIRTSQKTRKISLSLLLNDPSEYEGGDLQFDCRNKEEPEDNKIETVSQKQQGSLVIFPSFVFHRVVPVIKGVRYSLVMWLIGNKWL